MLISFDFYIVILCNIFFEIQTKEFVILFSWKCFHMKMILIFHEAMFTTEVHLGGSVIPEEFLRMTQSFPRRIMSWRFIERQAAPSRRCSPAWALSSATCGRWGWSLYLELVGLSAHYTWTWEVRLVTTPGHRMRLITTPWHGKWSSSLHLDTYDIGKIWRDISECLTSPHHMAKRHLVGHNWLAVHNGTYLMGSAW